MAAVQPLVLKLTGAEAADSPHLPSLIAGLDAEAVLADKGYDSDANRAAIRRQEAPSPASRLGKTARRRRRMTSISIGSAT